MNEDVITTPGEYYKRATGRGAWLIAQEYVSGYVAEIHPGERAEEIADAVVAHLNAKPKAAKKRSAD